jgi:integrase
MTSKRRGAGEGSIDERGQDHWRLRYRIDGKRFVATVSGTKAEAKARLRELLHAGDTGEHIEPSKITLAQWAEQWLALLDRGLVTTRTRERYGQVLASYVLPTLGSRPIQKITAIEIDRVYAVLEQRLSPTTCRHIHVVLGNCLRTAQKKIGLRRNPCADASPPKAADSDIAQALDAAELNRLLEGFKGTAMYPIVATAAFTGARLGELLALRWSDLNPETRELRIERAIETTNRYRRVVKEPKSKRGRRVITISDDLLSLLLREREKYLRMVAGIPDGVADVDLSLVKLPDGALMFPATSGPSIDIMRLRNPKSLTQETRKRFRTLGFATLRFHDLRASHGTALLDAGAPIHVVAARLGHSPAVLMQAYAKRNKTADQRVAETIDKLSKGMLS